jgi:Flp pilus assembly protein TadD
LSSNFALQLQPNNTAIMDDLGELLIQIGDIDGARNVS